MPRKTTRRRHTYTVADVKYICDNYATMSACDIALHIGATQSGVYQMAHRLGLHKDKRWIAERAREVVMAPGHGSQATRFKPGCTPATKGKQQVDFMTPEGIANSTRTRFKPGHKPANWRPVGSERVNIYGYREIKVAERRWMLLHRVVWERERGSIPRGYRVVFKDGNPLNCNINNLELITTAELCDRNNIRNYPEELRELMRLGGRLKRELNKQKRNNGKV